MFDQHDGLQKIQLFALRTPALRRTTFTAFATNVDDFYVNN
jgi:hypothetical protein